MLKYIPDILSPQLLKVLQEMGHGDCLCIGDGNFPGAEIARKAGAELIQLPGTGVCQLLDAILRFYPLDDHIAQPVVLMQNPPTEDCPIHDAYREIVARYDSRGGDAVRMVERFAYYEEAKKCYAVVMTSETATWANVIIQKGVVIHGDDGVQP